jgi:cell division inhibitor SulA/protein ImuA
MSATVADPPAGGSLAPAGDSLANRSVADRSVVPAGDSLASRSVTELARLLEHPAIWRGRSAARAEVLPTGYAAFDACLPGGGWPRTGLIEILVSRFGVGELYLLFPALAALTCRPAARWCVWVAPPLEPYAPALNAHGAALERMLVVRPSGDRAASEGTPSGGQRPSGQRGNPQRGRGNPQRGRAPEPLWAFEQTLGSGASDITLAWAARSPRARALRRLQLAAERGKTLGVLFRPQRAAQESSAAVLRLAVEPKPGGARITLLKSRGGARGSIEIVWPAR